MDRLCYSGSGCPGNVEVTIMLQLKKGMKAVVIGLGSAGLSTVKFLRSHGISVAVTEQRPLEAIEPDVIDYFKRVGIALETGGHSREFVKGADLVVPSPGVPLDLPILRFAREIGGDVIGELGLAAGRIDVPVVAVTGSNGKTTVTSLIGHLLRGCGKRVFVGGNIGTPLLEYFNCRESVDAVVLELSSFQLDLSGTFRPDIGLLLNLSPDHLDRHGSWEAYTAAKGNLFVNQQLGDIAILGEDELLCEVASVVQGVQLCKFGIQKHSDAAIIEETVRLCLLRSGRQVEESYSLLKTNLNSSVNQLNAAAAILAARLFDGSKELIQAALSHYRLPEHRMTRVAEINGISFVNDSKATNIGALQAALSGCTFPVVLIAGGRDKGSDFSQIEAVAREKVKHLVLIGEAAGAMQEALRDAVEIEVAVSMEEAVGKAFNAAESGDQVFLAPGCASFDMFSGYEERGRIFTECVEALVEAQEKN